MSESDNNNAGIAFGLVTIASLSTALGAAVITVPFLVKRLTTIVLAGGLAFSAGVMIYVSFVEIFQKAIGSFEDAGHEESAAYGYATGFFFGGCLLVVLLDVIVHRFLGGKAGCHDHTAADNATKASAPIAGVCVSDLANILKDLALQGEEAGLDACWEDDKVAEEAPVPNKEGSTQKEAKEAWWRRKAPKASPSTLTDATTDIAIDEEQLREMAEKEKNQKLLMMSLKTAMAIALHNFPEGLATFIAALHDPSVGVVLTIAIALHNIPEGLCVALPVYYSTKSKSKAFFWALLSGLSEVLAAGLGWAILSNSFNDNIYGAMFGIVAGMMVMISVRELLPTAHRYDEKDKVVSSCFGFGMLVMALSLVLLGL